MLNGVCVYVCVCVCVHVCVWMTAIVCGTGVTILRGSRRKENKEKMKRKIGIIHVCVSS